MTTAAARVSVNINDETAAIIRLVMAERGISATEATRLAIGLLSFVEDELAEGKVFYVERDCGCRARLNFF